jgi:hypothetical protein
MENAEFCIKIKLRNSASCWLLLYEYITMDDPQNVKSLESVNKSIHRKYSIMLIMQEGNAAVSAVNQYAGRQCSSFCSTINSSYTEEQRVSQSASPPTCD